MEQESRLSDACQVVVPRPPRMQLQAGSGKRLPRGASPGTKVGCRKLPSSSCCDPAVHPPALASCPVSALCYKGWRILMTSFCPTLRFSSITSPSWVSRMQVICHYGCVLVHYFSRTKQPCQHQLQLPFFPCLLAQLSKSCWLLPMQSTSLSMTLDTNFYGELVATPVWEGKSSAGRHALASAFPT